MPDRRTEPPTARRLRRARREGDHPVSALLVGMAGLACAALLLPTLVVLLIEHLQELLRSSLRPGAHAHLSALPRRVAVLVGVVLGPAALGALLLGLWQTGAGISFTPLRWDTRRLNPFGGQSRGAGATAQWTLLRWAVSGFALAYLAWRCFEAAGPALASSVGSAHAAARLAADLCQRLLWSALAVGLVAALADALWVRRAWYSRLRMTRQEVQREQRDNEGDIGLKQARLRVRRELASDARLGELPRAALVVLGRPRLATALAFDARRDAAPRILLHASGPLAFTLEALAAEHGVAVHEDLELARALAAANAGEPIPTALYAAVAAALRSSAAPER